MHSSEYLEKNKNYRNNLELSELIKHLSFYYEYFDDVLTIEQKSLINHLLLKLKKLTKFNNVGNISYLTMAKKIVDIFKKIEREDSKTFKLNIKKGLAFNECQKDAIKNNSINLNKYFDELNSQIEN